MERKPYQGTKTTVASSSEAIRKLLRKYGAVRIVIGETWAGSIAVEWARGDIMYRLELPATPDDENEERRLWRVLYWTVKAKAESVEAGLESYEAAFMGAMVDPASGVTLSQIVLPMIEGGAFNTGSQGVAALPKYTPDRGRTDGK